MGNKKIEDDISTIRQMLEALTSETKNLQSSQKRTEIELKVIKDSELDRGKSLHSKLEELITETANLQSEIKGLKGRELERGWELKVLKDRYSDKEKSLYYLGHGAKQVNQPSLSDTGEGFTAPPEHFIPEHPLSR